MTTHCSIVFASKMVGRAGCLAAAVAGGATAVTAVTLRGGAKPSASDLKSAVQRYCEWEATGSDLATDLPEIESNMLKIFPHSDQLTKADILQTATAATSGTCLAEEPAKFERTWSTMVLSSEEKGGPAQRFLDWTKSGPARAEVEARRRILQTQKASRVMWAGLRRRVEAKKASKRQERLDNRWDASRIANLSPEELLALHREVAKKLAEVDHFEQVADDEVPFPYNSAQTPVYRTLTAVEQQGFPRVEERLRQLFFGTDARARASKALRERSAALLADARAVREEEAASLRADADAAAQLQKLEDGPFGRYQRVTKDAMHWTETTDEYATYARDEFHPTEAQQEELARLLVQLGGQQGLEHLEARVAELNRAVESRRRHRFRVPRPNPASLTREGEELARKADAISSATEEGFRAWLAA